MSGDGRVALSCVEETRRADAVIGIPSAGTKNELSRQTSGVDEKDAGKALP
jgi:hypothetical protein